MRECGNCTLCCTITLVPELGKREMVRCGFCGDGCNIYGDRPNSCRQFQCEWLKGDLGEDMYPAESHIMVEKLSGTRIVLALIEPGYDDILNDEQITLELSRYRDQGMAVVTSNRHAMLPADYSQETLVSDLKEAARSMGVLQ